jgi:poly(3-hydroxybutyrate) depolymerase
MFRSPQAGPVARWYALVGRALVPLAVLACLAGPARAEVKKSTSSFPVGGKRIQVEHSAPDRSGKHPAVLLLHGSTGLSKEDANVYRYIACVLAQRGYVALLVHYFEGIGEGLGEPKALVELADG